MTATSWPMSSRPLQGEPAADQVEQERRDLRQEVVDELDQELPLVEVVADLEDRAETVGDVGALEVRRIVDMDRADAVDDLADAAGKRARRQLPFAAKADQPLAHLRDDDKLNRDDPRGDHAEPEALDDDEDQRRQRLAAKQRGLHEGVADEAAERLDLVLDHGGDFGGLHAA